MKLLQVAHGKPAWRFTEPHDPVVARLHAAGINLGTIMDPGEYDPRLPPLAGQPPDPQSR